MKVKTNAQSLVMQSVSGKVSQSESGADFKLDYNGFPFALPGTGGICYNVLVGNSAFGLAGDHIEPGVSTRGSDKAGDPLNKSYNFLSCIGNTAKIVSGEAKGEKGVVTGKHGGSERIMIDFTQDVMEELTHQDHIMIKTIGQGLQLEDHPDIRIANIDPSLFDLINVEEDKFGFLEVRVTHEIPGKLMGSGIGSPRVASGDYDITTQDSGLVKALKIDQLKFGDIVAIRDHDCVFGRTYKTDAVAIGIIVHSDCKLSGHGPGVTIFMASNTSKIKPILDPAANIAKILSIGSNRT